MGEFYVEQLVKRKITGKDVLIKVGMIALTALSCFFSMLIPFVFILTILLVVADVFVFQQLNVEYEYFYMNGDLDIDKIMAKQRRKRIFSVNLRDVEVVARKNAPELQPYRNLRAIDFSSRQNDANCYVLIIGEKGQKKKVIFEPEKEILEGMKLLAPRKVFL